MHRLEHALIVLRDLRRTRLDLIAPGSVCTPDMLKELDHINNAIHEVMEAQKCNRIIEDRMPSLITEALRALDWQATKAAIK